MADREVGSRKGRTLLKLLLVERGRMVSSDRIAEVLWGDDPPLRWERDLATLVSRLRAVFGSGAIAGGPPGYRFVLPERFELDLDDADRLVPESERRLVGGEPGLALAAAERALAILGRGELLEDELFADWAIEARELAGRLLRRARRVAWSAGRELGDHALATRQAEAAIAADPLDEEAYRALMLAHQARGQGGQALAAYEQLRVVLSEQLGADPSSESRELHAAILREEPVIPVAPTAGGEPGPRGDPAFVGREREFDILSRHWAAAARRLGGLVLLVGEAGIGKTRLAVELVRMAEATGGRVMQARCFQAERSLFLQPVADAIRSVVVGTSPDRVRDLAGEWAGPLGDLVPEIGQILRPFDYRPATPDIERRRIFEGIGSFLEALSADRPTLLFLDDIHDAGASTLELLHFLRRRSSAARLLILATVRVEEGGDALAQLADVAFRLEVGSLPAEAVFRLAKEMGAGDLAATLMERTRGHALFVVETLRSVADEGATPADIAPPESLVDAVLARVARAGRGVEELLRSAAILGAAFDLQTVSALADLSTGEAARRADRACRARLLVEAGPSFEFANDLVREILYRTVPLTTRTAGHARAAELLVANPEALAAHAAAAGQWQKAHSAWLLAGERAAARFANRDAERMFDLALDAAGRAGDPAGEARARLGRGRAREALAEYAGAYEDHWAAVERARAGGDRQTEMRALREMGGDVMIGIGRPSADSVPLLEAALAIAKELGDLPAEVDALDRLAVVFANRLQFGLAFERARRAEALARMLGDERALAMAMDGMKTAAAYSGELATLERVLPELERILRRRGDLWALQWAVFESSFSPMARGEWDRALKRVDDALALNRETGHVGYQPLFVAHLGWIHRSRGAFGEALSLGREAVRLAEGIGHPWWIAFAQAMLGWTLVEAGAVDEAVHHLELGVAVAERDHTENYLVRCLAHLAEAAWLAGRVERAEQALGRTEEILSLVAAPEGGAFLHGGHAVMAAARTRLAMGDPLRAAALAGLLIPAAERAGWVEPAAEGSLLVGRCRLALGRNEEAASLLSRALDTATAAGLLRVARDAHFALAEVRRAMGDPHAAGGHRAQAEAIADRLAASVGRERDGRRYVRPS